MTLASSGAMVLPTDLNSELRRSGSLDLTGSQARWLTERSSGSVTYPTHAYNKSAVKLMDLVVDTGNSSGSYTFNGVNFGISYTGRTLVVCTFLWATGEQALNISSVIIGGSGTSGNDYGEFAAGGPTAGAGIFANQASGTSGTVTVNHAANANGGAIALLSVAGVSSTAVANMGRTGTGSGIASFSDSLSANSNGVIISAVCRGNTSAIGWTGATSELVDQTVDSNFRIGVAFGNRFTSGSKTIGFTSSGTVVTGFHARSYG